MQKTILIATIALGIIACNQKKPQEEYIVNGTIKGIEDSSMIELYDILAPEDKPFDSAVVKDGKFQLKGKLDGPTYVGFKVTRPDTSLAPSDKVLANYFYIENANITFNADAATMISLYDESGKRKAVPEITGSPTQIQYAKLNEELKDIKLKINDIYNRMNKEYYIPMSEGKDVFDAGIKIQTELETVQRKEDEIIFKFIKENAASPVAIDQAIISLDNERLTAGQMENYVNTLKPEWENKKRFEQLSTQIENSKKTAIGEKMPDAEFLNIKGEKVLLSSLYPKDDYAMVEFWASWCGPCRAEIPHLKKLKKQFPKFNIIGVSIDEQDKDWKKAMSEEKMSWPQLNEPQGFNGQIASKYNISGIPAGFIIDKDSRIVLTNARGARLDKFLFETYGHKQPALTNIQ